jgi:cytochrome c biogenesis protein CcdA
VWDLLLTVLPLGLAAAVTPTLFALQVLVVSGPSWQSRALAVTLGSGAVFVVVFALVLAGLSQLPDAGTGKSTRTEYWIELVSGVVLIPIALWMLRPHPHADAALEKYLVKQVSCAGGCCL